MISDIGLLNAYMQNNQPAKLPEKNNLTDFMCYGPVYPFTNEGLASYPKSSLENKKTLSVIGSGDHILHAIYRGSNDVTGFDINRFCKYYAGLKIAMIRTYDFKRFKKNILAMTRYTCFKANKKTEQYDIYNRVFNDVSNLLTPEETKFFIRFLKLYNDIDPHLYLPFFARDGSCFSKTFYTDQNKYDNLKNKLNGVSIRYVDCGIDKLKRKLNDTYDVIYISNIIDRVTTFRSSAGFKILPKLYNILNPEGVIYDYSWYEKIFYDYSSTFKKYYDIEEKKIIVPYSDDCHSLNILRRR